MDLRSEPSRTVRLYLPWWSGTAEDFDGVLQAFLARYWLKTKVVRMVVRKTRNQLQNSLMEYQLLKVVLQKDNNLYSYVRREYKAAVVASGERPPPINEAEKLFPPLFFAEYEWDHNGVLRAKGNIPHRLDHPFSRWLLEHAVSLHQDYPGLFGQIRDALLASQSTDSPNFLSIEDVVQRINQSLQRIGKLNPELKPPEQAFLKIEDFGE